jgi:hypothetical protein
MNYVITKFLQNKFSEKKNLICNIQTCYNLQTENFVTFFVSQ